MLTSRVNFVEVTGDVGLSGESELLELGGTEAEGDHLEDKDEEERGEADSELRGGSERCDLRISSKKEAIRELTYSIRVLSPPLSNALVALTKLVRRGLEQVDERSGQDDTGSEELCEFEHDSGYCATEDGDAFGDDGEEGTEEGGDLQKVGVRVGSSLDAGSTGGREDVPG